MIKPDNTKKEVFLEIEKQLKKLSQKPKNERFSRFCWLANQIRVWEESNKTLII